MFGGYAISNVKYKRTDAAPGLDFGLHRPINAHHATTLFVPE